MTLADDRADRFRRDATANHSASTQAGVRATTRPTDFTLDDRYTREEGPIFLGGITALVRMIADRARVDRRQNLRTASFISGYEGSPLAGYDLELIRQRKLLDKYGVVHQPGGDGRKSGHVGEPVNHAGAGTMFGLPACGPQRVGVSVNVRQHSNSHGRHCRRGA